MQLPPFWRTERPVPRMGTHEEYVMRSVAYLTSVALFAAVATPALAQDASSARAPFTGPRIEGIVGWDRVQSDGHKDDVMYGVQGGYDVQMGGAVVGIEGEFTDSDTRTCGGASTVASPRVCVKAARDLYVGGRIGKVVGDRALVYVKAGYTNARAKLTSDNGTTETSFGHSNYDGGRVGAGVEYAMGPNSYVKAEYRYSNYEAGLERHQAVAGFGFRF